MKCAVSSCDRLSNERSAGYCMAHHKRLQVHGDVQENIPIKRHITKKKCIVNNCMNLNVSTSLGDQYCGKHHARLLRGQKVEAPSVFDKREPIIEANYLRIPLGLGAKQGYAIVDKKDAFIAEKKWYKSNDGYATTPGPVRGKAKIRMHHLVIGKPVHPIVVDHINQDKLDNRRSNLRFASYSLNSRNVTKRVNAADIKHIYYRKQDNRWFGQFKVDKVKYTTKALRDKQLVIEALEELKRRIL